MKKLFQAIVFMLLLFSFMNCGPSRVSVGARMDAPYYERPVRPGPNYVWVDGDWYYRNGRYEYHHGYWVRARNSRQWAPGIWIQSNNGWYWRKGKWQRH